MAREMHKKALNIESSAPWAVNRLRTKDSPSSSDLHTKPAWRSTSAVIVTEAEAEVVVIVTAGVTVAAHSRSSFNT